MSGMAINGIEVKVRHKDDEFHPNIDRPNTAEGERRNTEAEGGGGIVLIGLTGTGVCSLYFFGG